MFLNSKAAQKSPIPDRLPPHSLESEQGVLGCILLSPNDGIDECVAQIGNSPGAFYDLRHQEIFKSLMSMRNQQKPIDLVTIIGELKDAGTLIQIGGPGYLSELVDSVPSAMNLSYYLETVMDLWKLRRLVNICTETCARAYEPNQDVSSTLARAEMDVLAIARVSVAREVSMRSLVVEAVDRIEVMHQTQGSLLGLSTGLLDLDVSTLGLMPGEYTVLSGFPGSGKSALAMQIAEHIAVDQGKPVLFVSAEMSPLALTLRCLSNRSRVNLRSASKGSMTQGDFARLATASAAVAKSPIHIDASSDLSIYGLRARARRAQQKHGIKFIVVDYIQLLTATGGNRKLENRQQEVADISHGLKEMACELQVPVLALSQLNDDGKLRDSRAIGQDADCYWKLTTDETKDDRSAVATVLLTIEKQRNGPSPVTIPLTFLKTITRFESASRIDDDADPSSKWKRQPHHD